MRRKRSLPSSAQTGPGREIRRFGRLQRQLWSNFVVIEAEKADHNLYAPYIRGKCRLT
jgi:hypothetical protein